MGEEEREGRKVWSMSEGVAWGRPIPLSPLEETLGGLEPCFFYPSACLKSWIGFGFGERLAHARAPSELSRASI